MSPEFWLTVTNILADEAKQDSDVFKEFFELTDAEETFLERKASIRRSVRSSRKKNPGNQYFVEPTEDLHIETHSSHHDLDWSCVTYV